MLASIKILVKVKLMKAIESLPLKRRRSQHIINAGLKEAKLVIHEESDDPGVECNVGGDDYVVNAGNSDDASVDSEEISDLEECDSYNGVFEDKEEAI